VAIQIVENPLYTQVTITHPMQYVTKPAVFKNTMIRPNHTVNLLKTDYKYIKIIVETVSSAQDHCYTDLESK